MPRHSPISPSAALLPKWLVVLREINAPQSEIDWFTHMFTFGLDVVAPDTIVPNIHFSNYSSVNEYSVAFQSYLDEEVKNGFMLKTVVGDGSSPARVVPAAFIPKLMQPGKFRLMPLYLVNFP